MPAGVHRQRILFQSFRRGRSQTSFPGFANCHPLSCFPRPWVVPAWIHPELVSRDQNDTFGVDQADIVIVFDAPGQLPGVCQERIFSESLIPVRNERSAALVRTLPKERILTETDGPFTDNAPGGVGPADVKPARDGLAKLFQMGQNEIDVMISENRRELIS